MACTNPYKAWKIGLKPNGKADLRITSYSVDHLEYISGKDVPHFAMSSIVDHPGAVVYRDFLQIPCGQCTACRFEYSRQWANRCMLELEYHDSAYFVTLTYDEEHVPVSYYLGPPFERLIEQAHEASRWNDEISDYDLYTVVQQHSDVVQTGEAFPSYTLRKRDLQLFMKRLRFKFGDGIRFFAAGEYGSNTFRPHYHLIIFGLHLDDLSVYKEQRGFTYYNSPSLQECWSINRGSPRCPSYERLGYAVVAPVTWETCAYTARYVMKKLKGSAAQFYDSFSLEPPFTLMSRKPGIGYQWYVDHPDYNMYDYINVSTETGGRKFKPPKYFDYLFDLDFPEVSVKIKETRRNMAIKAQELALSNTDLPFMEYLKVKEHNLEDKVKKLIRSDF